MPGLHATESERTSHARYRQSFVDSCLAAMPQEGAVWIRQLEEVVRDEIGPLAADIDRQSRFPREATARLREIGAFGVAAARCVGGLGYGNAAAALMVETVAAACPSTAAILMFHHQVVGRIARFGQSLRHRRDLERLAAGEWIASSAWTELGAGADKSGLKTQYRRHDYGAVICGEKHFCTGLEGADLIHVLLDVPTENGGFRPTFARVERRAPGVDVSNIYNLMGLRGSSTGTLRLQEVPAEEADFIGEIGAGMQLMRANHETLMNPGLLALGIARSAYEDSKLSVQGLSAGSRSVANLQNVRLAIADMELKLGAAYAYAGAAARMVEAGASDLSVECTKIKVHASETACEIVAAATRLAGGRGFAEAWPFERHFRNAQATVLMGPINDLVRDRIAAQSLADLERRSVQDRPWPPTRTWELAK